MKISGIKVKLIIQLNSDMLRQTAAASADVLRPHWDSAGTTSPDRTAKQNTSAEEQGLSDLASTAEIDSACTFSRNPSVE